MAHRDGLAKVLRSEDPTVKPGYVVRGAVPFQQYFMRENAKAFEVLTDDYGLPWALFVTVLGLPSQAAYVGWKEYAKPKKGETIFVSAAAGSVGSLVVQFAKHDGLKVIASAGADDKVEWLRSLGADIVFNHKKESTAEVLKREGPLDIYFDNVGSETLDIALENAAPFDSRYLICGMISTYNDPNPYRLKNAFLPVKKQITMTGFYVNRLLPKWGADFAREMPELVRSGEIKYQLDPTQGLENAGQALVDVLNGNFHGKKVVVVADE